MTTVESAISIAAPRLRPMEFNIWKCTTDELVAISTRLTGDARRCFEMSRYLTNCESVLFYSEKPAGDEIYDIDIIVTVTSKGAIKAHRLYNSGIRACVTDDINKVGEILNTLDVFIRPPDVPSYVNSKLLNYVQSILAYENIIIADKLTDIRGRDDYSLVMLTTHINDNVFDAEFHDSIAENGIIVFEKTYPYSAGDTTITHPLQFVIFLKGDKVYLKILNGFKRPPIDITEGIESAISAKLINLGKKLIKDA